MIISIEVSSGVFEVDFPDTAGGAKDITVHDGDGNIVALPDADRAQLLLIFDFVHAVQNIETFGGKLNALADGLWSRNVIEAHWDDLSGQIRRTEANLGLDAVERSAAILDPAKRFLTEFVLEQAVTAASAPVPLLDSNAARTSAAFTKVINAADLALGAVNVGAMVLEREIYFGSLEQRFHYLKMAEALLQELDLASANADALIGRLLGVEFFGDNPARLGDFISLEETLIKLPQIARLFSDTLYESGPYDPDYLREAGALADRLLEPANSGIFSRDPAETGLPVLAEAAELYDTYGRLLRAILTSPFTTDDELKEAVAFAVSNQSYNLANFQMSSMFTDKRLDDALAAAAQLPVLGTDGVDSILGSVEDDLIAAGAGDDSIHLSDTAGATFGNDTIGGGEGTDSVYIWADNPDPASIDVSGAGGIARYTHADGSVTSLQGIEHIVSETTGNSIPVDPSASIFAMTSSGIIRVDSATVSTILAADVMSHNLSATPSGNLATARPDVVSAINSGGYSWSESSVRLTQVSSADGSILANDLLLGEWAWSLPMYTLDYVGGRGFASLDYEMVGLNYRLGVLPIWFGEDSGQTLLSDAPTGHVTWHYGGRTEGDPLEGPSWLFPGTVTDTATRDGKLYALATTNGQVEAGQRIVEVPFPDDDNTEYQHLTFIDPSIYFHGIAMTSDGALVGSGVDPTVGRDGLYTINLATGDTELVGHLPESAVDIVVSGTVNELKALLFEVEERPEEETDNGTGEPGGDDDGPSDGGDDLGDESSGTGGEPGDVDDGVASPTVLTTPGRLTGGREADVFVGSVGGDTLLGRAGNDILSGEGGGDFLKGQLGQDVLEGGDGSDRLFGNKGDDMLFGEADRDFLFGGAGRDMLYGGTGSDRLAGGKGDDVFYGGAGVDRYTGNAGADTFVLQEVDNKTVIRDFDIFEDVLRFDGVDALDLTVMDRARGALMAWDTSKVLLIGVNVEELAQATMDFAASANELIE